MNIDWAIFVISSVIAVFGAVMMIGQKNPVASVLYLILSFVAQAVLYVQLGALFVGVMLIIVYAGAIMVLFLFVIMLLNLRGGEDLGQHSKPVSKAVKLLISGLMLVELIFVIRGAFLGFSSSGFATTVPSDDFGAIRPVSMLLFTKYLYPFELTGVLMLIAVVGAVVISRKDRPGEYPENDTPELDSPQERPNEVIKGS
ncbi:MAG: NADH-quinone oxidoreductase subunit J [Candidatus Zixiibacteriota bacterium]